jgi:ribosomal-protein-alanine N-acetyltransferase
MNGSLPKKAFEQLTMPKPSVTVRKYLPADCERVMAISKDSPEAAQWPEESYHRAESAGQSVFVAQVEGRVCGFLVACYSGGEAEILNMAVDFSSRRQGVGMVLVHAALKELPGNSDVFLEVRESNRSAIAFYGAHGFSIVGKRTGYYRDPEENALLMNKITG